MIVRFSRRSGEELYSLTKQAGGVRYQPFKLPIRRFPATLGYPALAGSTPALLSSPTPPGREDAAMQCFPLLHSFRVVWTTSGANQGAPDLPFAGAAQSAGLVPGITAAPWGYGMIPCAYRLGESHRIRLL